MNNIDLKKCSICFEQLLHDVVCCKECEHWIHISCWRSGKCYLCRSEDGWRKLSRVEIKFQKKLIFECEGCKVKLNVLEMSKHIKICPKLFKCHLCKSDSLFVSDQLYNHLKDECPLLHEIPKLLCVYKHGCVERKFGLTFDIKTATKSKTDHLGFHRYQIKHIFGNDQESYYTFTTDVTWHGDVLASQPLSLFFDGFAYELFIPKFVLDKIEETEDYSYIKSKQECQICHVKINKEEVVHCLDGCRNYIHLECSRTRECPCIISKIIFEKYFESFL